MSDDELVTVSMQARAHASALRADIENAQSRLEHIRLTASALEAERLARTLEDFATRLDGDSA